MQSLLPSPRTPFARSIACSSDRAGLFAGIAALALCAAPAFAQTQGQTPSSTSPSSTPAPSPQPTAEPTLQDLIPDAAVADPEHWALDTDAARQPPDPRVLPLVSGTGPAALSTTATPGIQPVPDAAPDTIPGLTLPWPDADAQPAITPLTPDPDIDTAASAARDAGAALDVALPRGGWRGPLGADAVIDQAWVGVDIAWPADAIVPEHEEVVARFVGLSSLHALEKGNQNLAQIARRAKEDSALLLQIMRIFGYYGAEVSQTLAGGGEPTHPQVRFEIIPGTRYALGRMDLGDIALASDSAKLVAAFGVHTGDPANTDTILAGRDRLVDALGHLGHAFGKVGAPALDVDHDTHAADLTLPVTTGGIYNFGQVTSSLPAFLNARHLQRIARFRPGRRFDSHLIDDFRQALLATGIVGAVTITPREAVAPTATSPGVADIDVKLSRGPQHTVTGQVGQSSGEGFRLEASWEDRNFFPPEGMVRVRGVLGTREQLAGVTFRRSNFLARDQSLTADLYAQTRDTDAYNAHTVSATGSLEKQTTLIFQKPWSYSFGIQIVATSELAAGAAPGTPRTTYFIGALPVKLAFDHSNNLLDPTRGFRIAVSGSPEISVQDGPRSTYFKSQLDASVYQPVGGSVVLAARTRIASIRGTAIDNIAPSRRLYAGGGASIRGFGYQAVGPKDATGAPIGGLSLAEFSLEARVGTPLFGGALSVVPFVDSGMAGTTPTPTWRGAKIGAGIGVRYKTTFGPIRFDIGTPLNPSPGDSRIGVYIALGQAF